VAGIASFHDETRGGNGRDPHLATLELVGEEFVREINAPKEHGGSDSKTTHGDVFSSSQGSVCQLQRVPDVLT
jgi:hypothetical protein